jgi:hypothetical protein
MFYLLIYKRETEINFRFLKTSRQSGADICKRKKEKNHTHTYKSMDKLASQPHHPRTATVPTQKKNRWVSQPVCILKGKSLTPDRI